MANFAAVEKAHNPPIACDQRQMVNPVHIEQLQSLTLLNAVWSSNGRNFGQRGNIVIKCPARKNLPPEIAIRNGALKASMLVQYQEYTPPRLLKTFEGGAQCRASVYKNVINLHALAPCLCPHH